MFPSEKGTRKKYGVFLLAILLLLSGGWASMLAHNLAVRTLGIVAIAVSTYVVRTSHAQDRSDFPAASGSVPDLNMANGPGLLLWVCSLPLVPLLGVAFFLLHVDAVNGGPEGWPADVFAWVGLACAIVWGYLIAKIRSGT